MFANAFQKGDNGIEIFSPSGTDPLKHLALKNESGIQKSYDRYIKGNSLTLDQTSVSSSISCPRSSSKLLGIFQPWFCLQLNIPKGKSFSLELIVSDQGGRHHRFHFSTNFRGWDANELHARIAWPTVHEDLWVTYILNLEDLCRTCFRSTFQSLDHFTVYSCCQMRKIFSLPLRMTDIIIPAPLDFPVGVPAEILLVGLPEKLDKAAAGRGDTTAKGKSGKKSSATATNSNTEIGIVGVKKTLAANSALTATSLATTSKTATTGSSATTTKVASSSRTGNVKSRGTEMAPDPVSEKLLRQTQQQLQREVDDRVESKPLSKNTHIVKELTSLFLQDKKALLDTMLEIDDEEEDENEHEHEKEDTVEHENHEIPRDETNNEHHLSDKHNNYDNSVSIIINKDNYNGSQEDTLTPMHPKQSYLADAKDTSPPISPVKPQLTLTRSINNSNHPRNSYSSRSNGNNFTDNSSNHDSKSVRNSHHQHDHKLQVEDEQEKEEEEMAAVRRLLHDRNPWQTVMAVSSPTANHANSSGMISSPKASLPPPRPSVSRPTTAAAAAAAAKSLLDTTSNNSSSAEASRHNVVNNSYDNATAINSYGVIATDDHHHSNTNNSASRASGGTSKKEAKGFYDGEEKDFYADRSTNNSIKNSINNGIHHDEHKNSVTDTVHSARNSKNNALSKYDYEEDHHIRESKEEAYSSSAMAEDDAKTNHMCITDHNDGDSAKKWTADRSMKQSIDDTRRSSTTLNNNTTTAASPSISSSSTNKKNKSRTTKSVHLVATSADLQSLLVSRQLPKHSEPVDAQVFATIHQWQRAIQETLLALNNSHNNTNNDNSHNSNTTTAHINSSRSNYDKNNENENDGQKIHGLCDTLQRLESDFWREFGRQDYERSIGYFQFTDDTK